MGFTPADKVNAQIPPPPAALPSNRYFYDEPGAKAKESDVIRTILNDDKMKNYNNLSEKDRSYLWQRLLSRYKGPNDPSSRGPR